MIELSLEKLSKSYGELLVLNQLSVSIARGEILSVVGPSGCGKSTLLNLIAGLDRADSGVIRKHDSVAHIGYMMQEPHLLPWRTLTENAALGVEVLGHSNRSDDLLRKYMKVFELDSHADAYPSESSGGMKQRVALIRTLLSEPRVLLLDEPFTSLDFDIKLKVQREILNRHRKTGGVTILVTHDIEDSIALSDKVLVLSESPAQIKAELTIDLGKSGHDPVEARKSADFRDYFIKIWDELKYLDSDDGL